MGKSLEGDYVNKETFMTGGILFVIGLVALMQESYDASLFMTGIGIVFMATGLGIRACKELFDYFLSIFKVLFKVLNLLIF